MLLQVTLMREALVASVGALVGSHATLGTRAVQHISVTCRRLGVLVWTRGRVVAAGSMACNHCDPLPTK